ncbi:MAG: signal peptidase I (plasmid) [Nitrospira sp.]
MKASTWLKIVAAATVSGLALGTIYFSYLTGRGFIEWLGYLEAPDIARLILVFVFPSLCVWVAIARYLFNKPLSVFLLIGLCWPFIALFVGANVNHEPLTTGIDFFPIVDVTMLVLLLTLGMMTGSIMYWLLGYPDGQSIPLALNDREQECHLQPADSHYIQSPRPWVSFSLSLLPGLGQLYNGEYIKAGVCYLVWIGGATLVKFFILLHVHFKPPYNVIAAVTAAGIIYVGIMAEALVTARRLRNDPRARSSHPLRWFIILAVVFLVNFTARPLIRTAIYNFYAAQHHIQSSAMDPTLIGDDIFLVDLRAYTASRTPQRGDIISIRIPNVDVPYFRRVVGLPGETLAINHDGIWINGTLLNERISMRPTISPISQLSRGEAQAFGPIVVPDGTVFVLADNLATTFDSREFGPIAMNHINGRVAVIYWSWDGIQQDARWERIGQMFSSTNP